MCLICPLRDDCRGRDRAEEFPVKARVAQVKRTETVAIIRKWGKTYYCEQVPEGKPWHGLWRFPDFDPVRMDAGRSDCEDQVWNHQVFRDDGGDRGQSGRDGVPVTAAIKYGHYEAYAVTMEVCGAALETGDQDDRKNQSVITELGEGSIPPISPPISSALSHRNACLSRCSSDESGRLDPRRIMITSGCPKNQKRCFQRSGWVETLVEAGISISVPASHGALTAKSQLFQAGGNWLTGEQKRE